MRLRQPQIITVGPAGALWYTAPNGVASVTMTDVSGDGAETTLQDPTGITTGSDGPCGSSRQMATSEG